MVYGLTAIGALPKTLKDATFTVQSHEPRELLFLHKERGLGAHLTLRGDEKIAPTVKLEPLGTLRGRILDEDGQPKALVRIRLFQRPGRLPNEPIITEKDGTFRFESVIPGLELSLVASEKATRLSLGDEQKRGSLSLRPGEEKDLGDLKAKPAE